MKIKVKSKDDYLFEIIQFQCFLEEKGLIPKLAWDKEEVAEIFYKSRKKYEIQSLQDIENRIKEALDKSIKIVYEVSDSKNPK